MPAGRRARLMSAVTVRTTFRAPTTEWPFDVAAQVVPLLLRRHATRAAAEDQGARPWRAVNPGRSRQFVWSAYTWRHRRPLLPTTRWDGAIMLKTHNDVLVPMAMEEVAEVAAQIRHVKSPSGPDPSQTGEAEPDAVLSR